MLEVAINLDAKIERQPLVPQALVERSDLDWHRAVFKDLADRIDRDPRFPCPFAKSVFKKGLLQFIFIDDLHESSISHLARGVREYVRLARQWDGSLGTAHPLIVAFSLHAIASGGVEDYHAFGWTILQQLHDRDPAPWPRPVAIDPHSPSWSMCFDGMALFCNMSLPAHRIRRSRNLGRHFLIVINPRARFDVVAGDTPEGRKTRENIRERINHYDGIPCCPQLGSYGSSNLEWWQYGLVEDNRARADRCPFQFHHFEGDLPPKA